MDSIQLSIYKIEHVFLKILPMLLALDVMLKMILVYFEWNPLLLSYIGGASILPLAFISLSAYVFKFCWYHKMFLVYVAVDLAWNIVDCIVNFPLYINKVYAIMMFVVGVVLFVVLELRDKKKHPPLLK